MSVKVVVADKAPVFTALPLCTLPISLSMAPVPLVKVAVRVVLLPISTVDAAAVKLVIDGMGTTVTVACAVTEPPTASVAVRV